MTKITSEALTAQERFLKACLAYRHAIIYINEIHIISLSGNVGVRRALLEFEDKTKMLGLDATNYFLCHIFSALISAIELYFQEILKSVISENPKKIGSTLFKLSEILDSSSTDELLTKAIDDYLNKLMYKKPLEYPEELTSTLSIDAKTLEVYWPDFVEVKARRDLGVHNSWVCNATYLRKIKEAGLEVGN
jgi:hypothetical protein